MNFWDFEEWSFIITLSLLLGGMMAANVLRRVIKPIRQSLIPSSVLGGFLLLILGFLYKKATGNTLMDTSILESLTYHGLGLGFVAISLKSGDSKRNKSVQKDTLNYGIITVATYILQSVIGLAITLGLSFSVAELLPGSGMLLSLGYGQGPGQAYNWGHTYETTWGFDGGTSFGLTIAAMGFISASIGGVLYLAIMKRKGKIKGKTYNDETDETMSQYLPAKDEIPLSESMDKLTVQVALVFLTYILAYLAMYGIDCIIESGLLGDFGYNTVQPLVWGFNFLFGTVAAIIVKNLMKLGKRKGIIHREYSNDFLQTRISGFMFDLMVVASIAAIDLSAFKNHTVMLALVAICVFGAIVTYLYVLRVCRKLFPTYADESFLGMYGMLTGTNSTGIILLREIDPLFKTPTANNLVYQSLWAIVFGFPVLLLFGIAPQSRMHALITFAILVALFGVFNVILFRESIFRKKKKNK